MRRLVVVVLAVTAVSCDCGKTPGLMMNNPVAHLETDSLDFGAVTEFTDKQLPLPVRNLGRVSLSLTAAIDPGGSAAEFTVDTPAIEVGADQTANVLITFRPLGAGSDTATLTLTTNDPDQPTIRVTLKGGPIFPTLGFNPDPLDFRPATMPLVTKSAVLKNVGQSTLTVNAVGVDVTGNPDFSVTPPMLPLVLRPGQMGSVDVAYARSTRDAEGRLQADSDDPDAGSRFLRLIPDPPAACSDGLDNDMDGLTDFPDDIGCLDSDDTDESNPPQCINGASQPCGSSTGICTQGLRTCANSIWGACDGGVRSRAEACNGVDDDCNGVSDDGVSETCTIFGCAGARACLPDAGVDGGLWTACLPISATTETCDGLDNNCNGQVDEGVVRTCTLNSCLGVQVCIPDGGGAFTQCSAANPLPETCNGVDDDCNGSIDDGLANLVCGVGACRRSVPACNNGAPNNCVPGQPNMEICNGADDDCDGALDNGLGNVSCGVGYCARSVAACVLGDAGVCMAGSPRAETCNGIDDDCNNVVDDGLANLTCGNGACFRSVPACNGGAANSCVPGNPVTETCNNVDDDCNGTVDNMPNLTCGVGACARTAVACTGGVAGTCTPGMGTAETCNNVDDDCNGAIDNGVSRACYSGSVATRGVGTCRDGTQTCTAGVWQATCPGEQLPVAENCGNSLDDDCDGTVNNGCSGCNPNGIFTIDAGTRPVYTCCFSSVVIDISQIQILSNGTTLTPGPSQPGVTLTDGGATTCPSGTIYGKRVLTGGCTETYTLTGVFTGPNNFSGTYTAQFTGSQCSCFGGADTPCTNQTWTFGAGR
ncbi:MAG: MopE-related protein [Myxococcaceae bacterium]